MRAIKRVMNQMKSSMTLIIVCSFLFFIGLGAYYNQSVVCYQAKLNEFSTTIYEETSPTDAVDVYQTILNLEGPYENRVQAELKDVLVSRYNYYSTLYKLRKVEYDVYLKYEQIIMQLFPTDETVKATYESVQMYYESQLAYIKGDQLKEQGLIEEAITSYQDVLFNDAYYYKRAQNKIQMCLDQIREQYLDMAKHYFENEEYNQAINQLNYLTLNGSVERIESLKWYYQSEYYGHITKEISRLTRQGKYGQLISYLEAALPYLGEQYTPTLELKLSEFTLLRAQRRDRALNQYQSEVSVWSLPKSNQQLITYNKVSKIAGEGFDELAYAKKALSLSKVLEEKVVTTTDSEEDFVQETFNFIPYVLTNPPLTSASFHIMVGYYGEIVNEFKTLNFYVDQKLVWDHQLTKGERQQVFIEGDNQVIEWLTLDVPTEKISSFVTSEMSDAFVEVEFVGDYVSKRVTLSKVELELMSMMIEIYEAIMV